MPLWTGGAGFLAALSQLSGLNLARTHLAADQLCVLGSLSALKALNISEASLGQDAAVHVRMPTPLTHPLTSISLLCSRGSTRLSWCSYPG